MPSTNVTAASASSAFNIAPGTPLAMPTSTMARPDIGGSVRANIWPPLLTRIHPPSIATDAAATYSTMSISTCPGHCTTTRLSWIQGSRASPSTTWADLTEMVGTPATTLSESSRSSAVEFSAPRTTTSRTERIGLCRTHAPSAAALMNTDTISINLRRRRALSSETPRLRSSIRGSMDVAVMTRLQIQQG